MENKLPSLEKGTFRAGFNQAQKHIEAGRAKLVYLATDAPPALFGQIRALCLAKEVPFCEEYDKKALGKLCALDVGCAVAVVLKKGPGNGGKPQG